MKTYSQRLTNISGQIEGIKKMIESEADCVQILTQLKAVRSAVNSVLQKYMAERIEQCIKTGKTEEFDNLKKLIVKTSE